MTINRAVPGPFGSPDDAASSTFWSETDWSGWMDPAAGTDSDPAAFGRAGHGGMWHPAAATTMTDTLYLQEPGDAAAISVNDLHQGQLGDCFLIASIGELALFHPSAISNMIHVNTDGSETVTLYTAGDGTLPGYGTTSFAPVSVSVSNVFPDTAVNNAATQDVVGNQKEIWPQVLEKAVATLDGGYSGIANGGNPMIAMEELTGQAATYVAPSKLTLAMLQGYLAAGDLVTMDTRDKSSLPHNLVGDHAYMFEGVTVSNGVAMVQLGNPWGLDQPTAIPLSQLGRGVAEVDVGKIA